MRRVVFVLGAAVIAVAGCTPATHETGSPPAGSATVAPLKTSGPNGPTSTSCFAQHDPPGERPAQVPPAAHGPFEVDHVADGDTLTLDCDHQKIRVRLIGVDTPETVDPDEPVQCYGPEASHKTKQLASTDVWIGLDPSQGIHDRYGRTLAYVWVANGTMINKKLIADGYGREYAYYRSGPYKYQQQFKKAETKAQARRAGLWGECEKEGRP